MRRSMKHLPYNFNVMNELGSIKDETQAGRVVGSGNAMVGEGDDDLFDDDDANDADYDPLLD